MKHLEGGWELKPFAHGLVTLAGQVGQKAETLVGSRNPGVSERHAQKYMGERARSPGGLPRAAFG